MTPNFRNEHLTRQADLIPEDALGEQITIIGAGAIGSWVTLALAKMGFENLTVFDHDTIEIENMNSQFYPMRCIGESKVQALCKLVHDFTEVKVTGRPCKYERGHFPGIVIAAVDSMAVRRNLWENHKGKSFGTRAVIDPRMGAENALLYVMNPMDAKDQASYESSLYADGEAIQERCTAKATIYTANMLSGLVCKAVKDLVTRPDYLRTAQWNIAENAFLGHSAKVSC